LSIFFTADETDTLSPGTVIALDASDFASSVDDAPLIDVTNEAIFVNRDDPGRAVVTSDPDGQIALNSSRTSR